jgi:hypothetical protein
MNYMNGELWHFRRLHCFNGCIARHVREHRSQQLYNVMYVETRRTEGSLDDGGFSCSWTIPKLTLKVNYQ